MGQGRVQLTLHTAGRGRVQRYLRLLTCQYIHTRRRRRRTMSRQRHKFRLAHESRCEKAFAGCEWSPGGRHISWLTWGDSHVTRVCLGQDIPVLSQSPRATRRGRLDDVLVVGDARCPLRVERDGGGDDW
jgi:hypothetical protein